MSIQVTFHSGEFTCRSTFEQRNIPRSAGFSFDSRRKCWYSFDHKAAARLRPYLDESAKREISRILLTHEPWSGAVPYPLPLRPEHFQIESARFALSRNRSYLGLDAGLGKTIVAALIMNAKLDTDFIYICPPFLIPNVRAEMVKWRTKPSTTLYFADSMLDRSATIEQIKTSIAYSKSMDRKTHLIVDEAHRFCVPTSRRTKSMFGRIVPLFENQTFMSGTPMRNRPIELYPVLFHVAPETIDFMSKFEYAQKYCSAHHNGFGWDYSGSSNLPDLKQRTQVTYEDYRRSGEDDQTSGKFMLRVRKEVLNLPPLVEEMVILGDDLPPKIGAMDRKIMQAFGGEDLMKNVLAHSVGKEDLHISTYRKELGKAKADSAIPFIKAILDETDESVVVAAWHKEATWRIIEGLKKYDPVVIDGSTDPKDRVGLANEFQNNPDKRLVILNIVAGGIGLNLQKATRVVFAEASWVPGDNDQAADRAHRYGTKESVLVQYLVYQNSVDRAVMETLLNKRRTTRYI